MKTVTTTSERRIKGRTKHIKGLVDELTTTINDYRRAHLIGVIAKELKELDTIIQKGSLL